MEMHLKIGEIANMFEISIRALRLYDKMGLLIPGYTDGNSGYRYYTADQVQQLNTILVLKSVGIKLIDIKHLFDHGMQAEKLVDILQKKKDYWENQIEIARFNIENIDRLRTAALHTSGSDRKTDGGVQPVDAYKMSRLVCLENLKLQTVLSEALWL
ncbi:MAG TPA: MerR family transcriptional regulator [Clostridia bacterium]|nr:MerR family transcriptional regulator [Clostridia bacterium]